MVTREPVALRASHHYNAASTAGGVASQGRLARRGAAWAWILAALLAWPAFLHAQTVAPPCAACVVAELSPEEAAALAAARPSGSGPVRVLVPFAPASSADTIRHLARPDVDLTVELPPSYASIDPDVLRAADGVVFDLRAASTSTEAEMAFQIKRQSIDAKARKPGIRVGVDADAALIAALVAHGVGPYVDFVIRSTQRLSPLPPGLRLWVRDAAVARGNDALAPAPDAAAEFVVRPLSAAYAVSIGALEARIPRGLVPLDTLHVRCEPACRATPFFDPASVSVVAILDTPSGLARLDVEHAQPADLRVFWLDQDGRLNERSVMPGAEPGSWPARVFVHAPPGTLEGTFATGVRVTARPTLTVDEVLARHQQARERQRRALNTLISSGRTVLTFEAPGFVAPITIAAETVLYQSEGGLEVEQRDIRVNGLALAGASGVPRLPLIEPERIATPPLALTLSSDYRYRLAGDEVVAGHRCYVLAFDGAPASVSGRAWISMEDFGLARLAFVQRTSRGPIVSNEQRDDFMRGVEGDTVVWLPWRTEAHQMYEGPAHRTPIHRVTEIAAHELNPPDFEARLGAAHAGPAVMLRETDRGFRYLERTRASSAAEPAVRIVPARESERVRTLAFGAIIDPNITRPLPFAGLSFLDFNLLGSGAQINAFAGLGYGRAALTTPGIAGSRWQVVADAFAIAARYNDRVFIDGRERYELNLRQRPAHAMAGVMAHVAGPFRVRAEYHADHTALTRADTTAPDFIVPPSPTVHAARISVDVQRRAWSGDVWWSPAVRQRWRAWGTSGSGASPAEAGDARTFQTFGASIARSFILSPKTVARMDLSWMDGRDLDRFSRYTFGTFDNRLHGYPAASIRYDRGAVVRSVVSATLTPRLRVDGFVDAAAVHERAAARRYVGVGTAVEAPLPLGFLTSVEWGYGVRGIRSGGGEGTHVLRLSAYKIF
jgi:hypothetical protein